MTNEKTSAIRRNMLRHHNGDALHFSKKSLNKVILICIDVSYLSHTPYSRLMYYNYTNIHIRTVQKFMTVDKEGCFHLLNLLTSTSWFNVIAINIASHMINYVIVNGIRFVFFRIGCTLFFLAIDLKLCLYILFKFCECILIHKKVDLQSYRSYFDYDTTIAACKMM